MLSLRDFSHARSSIVFVREDVDFDAKYPLAELRRFICYETTLIVAYCRPFSESTGGLPRLSFRALGVKPTPFVRKLHDSLIDKRNQIFAHSDVTAIEHSEPRVMRGTDTTGLPFTVLVPPRFQEGTLLSRNEFEQASVLVDTLSNAVVHQLQAMHHHFVDRYPSFDLHFRDAGSVDGVTTE
ncbi:hypothetical protein [Neoaquamicrobium sediminum]|nr:hypothetical protein [Mesorhizobium sediminum]NRC54189.1 hypothetical protein [Mesorhizobium sediminum]